MLNICAMPIVQCILYNIHYTLYNMYNVYTLYIITLLHYTFYMYNVECTLYFGNVHSIKYIIYFTCRMPEVECTLVNVRHIYCIHV